MGVPRLRWSWLFILEISLKPVCATHTGRAFSELFCLCVLFYFVFHWGEEAWCKGSVAKLGCTVCVGTPSSQLWIMHGQKSWLGPKGRDQSLKMKSRWSTPGNISLHTSRLTPKCPSWQPQSPFCWLILYCFPFHYLKSHCLFPADPPLGQFHNQPIACSKHLTCSFYGIWVQMYLLWTITVNCWWYFIGIAKLLCSNTMLLEEAQVLLEEAQVFGLFSCDSYMYINYTVSWGRTK